jgi:hypothetical protein
VHARNRTELTERSSEDLSDFVKDSWLHKVLFRFGKLSPAACFVGSNGNRPPGYPNRVGEDCSTISTRPAESWSSLNREKR